MSLTIEVGDVRVENINHPEDFCIYFSSGFIVWNYVHSGPLSVWYKGDMFVFSKELIRKEIAWQFFEWVRKQNESDVPQQ